MYLLDTNICIYVMKNSYPELTQKVLSHKPSDLCISSITVYELEYGAAKSNWGDKTRNSMQMFLAPFNIIDFDSKDAAAAGIIRGILEKQGNPIGPYDVQIAGQAVAKSLILVTHNVSEFGKVPNLTVEDWVVPSV
jgi:tRNA(fMet)-specific endonuclease VapC